MLNYRIAECDVKTVIRKLTQIRDITEHGTEVRTKTDPRLKVHSGNVHIVASSPTSLFPKLGGSAEVDDAQRSWKRLDKLFEAAKTLRAHAVRERIWVLYGCESANQRHGLQLTSLRRIQNDPPCVGAPASSALFQSGERTSPSS